MTNENTSSPSGLDWTKVAQDALDLWQDHLTSLATDPAAKEEMTRFIAPMGQMFTQWTSMMQTGLESMGMRMGPMAASSSSTETASSTPPSSFEETMASDDRSVSESPSSTTSGLDDPSVTEPALEPVFASAIKPVCFTGDDLVAVDNIVYPGLGKSVAVEKASVEPVIVTPAATVATAKGGRAPSSDSTRDLAQLASRLAQLERELESMRGKSDGDESADSVVTRLTSRAS